MKKLSIVKKKAAPVLAAILAMTPAASMTAFADDAVQAQMPAMQQNQQTVAIQQTQDSNGAYSLDFSQASYTTKTLAVDGQDVVFRAYEGVVYVTKPVDTTYESMNIYIPEDYFNGKTINGYTADTAPIFFPNSVGGYMPGAAGSPSIGSEIGGGAGAAQIGEAESPNAALYALSKGYVVAEPGARGRTNVSSSGEYYGKAPACIVDLKAAVRYLRYNDKAMPGDAEKIISNGTSAGGAVSALLGATGNSSDYEPYLEQIGAANERDDIYATMAYCPITNLDNADAAYEWQFNGVNNYDSMNISFENGQMQRSTTHNTMTDEQTKLSDELKAMFPSYVNGLGLTSLDGTKLTLDSDGNGSFKDYVENYVIVSAQKALDSGTDMSAYTWLTITDGKVTAIDFSKYVQYMARMKAAPAFDDVALTAAENNEFGTSTVDSKHFTQFSSENSTAQGGLADSQIIKMMNPMNYIGTSTAATSPYWRIRYGTKDSNTGLAIPVILATELENKGYNVDFAMPWDVGHSGDYDLDELFSWADGICKGSNSSGTVQTSGINIDGTSASVSSFESNGTTYYALRDIAKAFAKTDKKFDVSYNAENGSVIITTGKAYENGSAAVNANAKTVENPKLKIYSDNTEYTIASVNAGGTNFVTLSSLSKIIGFNINSETGAITTK